MIFSQRYRPFVIRAALTCGLLLLNGITLAEGPGEGRAVSVNDVEQGSLLVRAHDDGPLHEAPLLDTDVQMQVNGMIARVRLRQTFSHTGTEWVNGIYVFPLPEEAAVDRLRMIIGERVVEGRIETRAAARKTFTAAKQAGKKATLVEQQRPNLFTTSVANIAPGESVVVEIEYQQTLAYADGWFSLRFPMTVGIRYIPGSGPVAGFDAGGWSYNTDQVPDASAITPPVTAAGEGYDNPVAITIDLNAGMPLAEIKSTYHPITTAAHAGHRYSVQLTNSSTLANRDFELRFRPADGHAPRAAFFRQEVDGEVYGLLMLVPPEASWSRDATLAREVVFVVDTSGSMHGTSINQARAALKDGLQRLAPDDTFNIIQFNSVAQRFSPQALPATPGHLARAAAYVNNLSANGGTEMAAALDLALDGKEVHERLRQVIFITDGSVGNEEALFEIIDARLGASRLFTIGIGSAPNSYFMREAATLGRGTFDYIGDTGEVSAKMRKLFEQLAFPVLADIRLEGGNGKLEVWPDPLRDLYVHEPLIASLRLDNQAELELHGRLAGKAWSTRVPVASGGAAAGLDVAWARQKIASLERSLARGANRQKVRKAIANLGLKHHLVTRHTSLVAVDVTPVRPATQAARDQQVANKKPAGWQMATPARRLPQTATPLGLWVCLSVLLGLAGAVTHRLGRSA